VKSLSVAKETQKSTSDMISTMYPFVYKVAAVFQRNSQVIATPIQVLTPNRASSYNLHLQTPQVSIAPCTNSNVAKEYTLQKLQERRALLNVIWSRRRYQSLPMMSTLSKDQGIFISRTPQTPSKIESVSVIGVPISYQS